MRVGIFRVLVNIQTCFVFLLRQGTLFRGKGVVEEEAPSKYEGELRKEGLWLVVEKGDTTASAASGSSASLVTITVPLRDTFAERDSRALALWEALKKEYSQAKKTEIAFALLQQLLWRKLRLEDGQEKVTLSAMTAHVDKFASDLNRLDGLDSVDADLQPLFLRRTLPKTSDKDDSDSGSDTDTPQANTVSGRYCAFQKSTTHDTSDCKAIKAAETASKAQKSGGKGKEKGKAKAQEEKTDKANSANDSDSETDDGANVAFT
ncbi:hypothetical protein R3P38DRAFT_2775830 [Favolaschia claudopus]|uniref:Uncharacterized protein n=1 Tax=Favolaschia claudopus TaxID=2862362 RepID=A0AAW0BSA4_9AGAR